MTKTVIQVYGGSPKKRGSLEEYFLLLNLRLRERGWRSVYCCDRLPDGELLGAFLESGAEVHIIRSTRSRADFSLIAEFRELFRNVRPDVVNSHFGRTSINALIAATLAGVSTRISTKHSLDRISYGATIPWHKQWLHTINYSSLWSTHIIAVSKAVEAELLQHHIKKKVYQCYLGVDRRRFIVDKPDPGVMKELGVPHGSFVVSCIGQARPEKGIEFLVRAVAVLKGDSACPFVVIVGGGPLTPHLQDLARELGIADRICFCGVRNDVESILALSKFTVLPSLEEAAGLAIMESLAAGKPVVASRVGGIPELVKDDVNGLLVEPRSVSELAAAIRRLCDDPECLARLTRNARPSSEAFDIERGVDQTIALYCRGGERDED